MTPLDKVAERGKLSLGLVFPLEAYSGSVPQMENQVALAQQAEAMGFKSLWFRDVPLHDPTFGDAGQMYDPFVYMTHIMNHSSHIALATGSIILPLRHPIHTLKSINSLQLLSKGRIIIGIASGDRPIEFPAFDKDLTQKNELFRDSFFYLKALKSSFPSHTSTNYGQINANADLLPKSNTVTTPYLVTGHSGQTLEWIAQHADGWLYYPRNTYFLTHMMNDWHQALESKGQPWKPFMQSLYIDLIPGTNIKPTPIHLGFRTSADNLLKHLHTIRDIGVNHVILNLKFNSLPVEETMAIINKVIIPELE